MSNSWTYTLPQKEGVVTPNPESIEDMSEWLSEHYPNFNVTSFHESWDRQIAVEDNIGPFIPEFITENGTLLSVVFETNLGDNEDFPLDSEWAEYHTFFMNWSGWDTPGSWTKNTA